MSAPSGTGRNTSVKLESLKRALHRKRLLRFWSPYEPGSTTGYVLGLGPRFVLLAVVGETIRFDGFQCLRISDMKRLEVPFRYEKFVGSALHKRNQIYPVIPAVDLKDMAAIINSASKASSLITIHRQQVDPDSCWIGRVIEVSESHLNLLEIAPDAKWQTKPSRFRLRDITRVDFGGGYEEALELVGGPPPSLQQKKISR